MSLDIRSTYLNFFKNQNHVIIPPASLIPENDPTTLFTSAGMQQLVPNILGEPHPQGSRLTNSQPCFRSQDIEEIGDNRHTSFFEMLGNWSLGDYFKKDQLTWFYHFLTQELNLDPQRIYVTVFAGNDQVPKDQESINIWQKLGLPKDHIFEYGVTKNWWSRSGAPDQMPAGEPGGTTSEVFYEFPDINHDPKFGDHCHPNCDCGRFMEIGNSVFMEFEKQADGSLKPLTKKSVDFGGGLERLTAALDQEPDIFKTIFFHPLIKIIESHTQKTYKQDNLAPMRIIADHLKATTFMISAQLEPSNKTQGYLLRRLIRRATLKLQNLSLTDFDVFVKDFVSQVFQIYQPTYLTNNSPDQISQTIISEIHKFQQTLNRGLKEFNKHSVITGQIAFDLFQTYGFPFEITQELTLQKGQDLNYQDFLTAQQHHADQSRTAAKGLFQGGLADHSETTTKYHTATHLLHQALQEILGDHVHQVGSNITSERLRFDFTHPQALTSKELSDIEKLINDQITANLPVTKSTMSLDEAVKKGAQAFFKDKYADKVTVYQIGDFSLEVCGGPHVAKTGDIGKIEIYKQESVGNGKRRLYARLA